MSTRRVAGGLVGAAALIAVITVVSRMVGFGRWLVFSGTVGTTCTGTAYLTANVLPNVLFEVVAGGALAASVVPLLSAPLVHRDQPRVDRTASALLTWSILVLLPLSVLLAVLAGPLVSLFPVHGDGSVAGCAGTNALAARMLLVFAPQVVLYGIGIVLSGVLQAHRRFAAPALAPLLSSVVVIASYLMFASITGGPGRLAHAPPERRAELVLSVGTTLGVAALSLPLLVPVVRVGVRLRPTLRFPAGVGSRAGGLALAGIAGLVAQQSLVLVTLRLSNGSGGTGSITVYQYVQAVYVLPYAVLAVPLAVAAFPQLSERAALADGAGYARTLARSTRAVVVASGLGAAVLVGVAPAVGRFFAAIDAGRGGAGGGALDALGITLAAFAPGLIGFALIAHLGRALFAVGRARWAAAATVAGWLVAAVLSVVLVGARVSSGTDPRATLVSLGIASSTGMSVAGLLLLIGTSRVRLAGAVPDGLLRGVPRAVAVTAVAGLAAAVAGRWCTEALLPGGALAEALGEWQVGHGSVHAVVAGAVGALVTGGIMVAVFAVTDGGDLRAVLRRGPAPSSSADAGPELEERADA